MSFLDRELSRKTIVGLGAVALTTVYLATSQPENFGTVTRDKGILEDVTYQHIPSNDARTVTINHLFNQEAPQNLEYSTISCSDSDYIPGTHNRVGDGMVDTVSVYSGKAWRNKGSWIRDPDLTNAQRDFLIDRCNDHMAQAQEKYE